MQARAVPLEEGLFCRHWIRQIFGVHQMPTGLSSHVQPKQGTPEKAAALLNSSRPPRGDVRVEHVGDPTLD
eukprot:3869771-Alexandrium_andersonii.AAC.1